MLLSVLYGFVGPTPTALSTALSISFFATQLGSVYKDIDASKFHMDKHGNPSPMMRASLLYKLHGHRLMDDVKLAMDEDSDEPKFFTEAYTSKNSMVRIYKVKNVSQKSRNKARSSSFPTST